MNEMQKRAWACVIVMPLFLTMAFILFVSRSDDFDMRRALYGFAFLAILALTGLTPIICQKHLPNSYRKVQQGFKMAESGYRLWTRVGFDERDRLIKQRANLAGYVASCSFFGGVCMLTGFVLGPRESISVSWLPVIFVGGMLTQIFVRSVAILVQYGWKDKGEKS